MDTLRRLREATEAARDSRAQRTTRRHTGTTPRPSTGAGRARRPASKDAPRRPAAKTGSGAPSEATTAVDTTEALAAAPPAASPLIPETVASPTAPATTAEATTISAAPAEPVVPTGAEGAPATFGDGTATSMPAAPPTPPASHPAERAPRPVLLEGPLPDGYATDVIRLMARDPEWLFAYWEVTPSNWQRARDVFGDTAHEAQLVLRVYAYNPPEADSVESSYDIEVMGPARSWYVHAGRPGVGYEVELGLRGPDGVFVGLVRSNRTVTPRDTMSAALDEEWRCLEHEFREIFQLSGGHQVGSSSLELRELIARRMQEVMGSEAVSSFGASEAMLRERRQRGFWFVLGTELIVYGATEPDAKVTCQGKQIQLRPDGTFTLRFALPDGHQDIPCTARSADGVDTITITPSVEKWTQREEHSLDDPAFTANASPGDREQTEEPWRRK